MKSSPVSVRRYRVRDLALLAVRIGIIAAAALALAQPVWPRPGAPAARPARAVVLDTSASLQRVLADGRLGADVARETATAALSGAGGPEVTGAPAVTIATERLSDGVAEAAAWLATQPAPRELVVVSDFQVGALVESDFDNVPEDANVRLVPIAVSGPVPAAPAPARGQLRVLAGREEAARAAASEAAARAVTGAGAPETTSGVVFDENDTRGRFEVILVFPGAAEREQLRQTARVVHTPELFDLVADIQRERRRLGASGEIVFSSPDPNSLIVLTDADPGGAPAAVLMTSILRALGPTPLAVAEREPDTLPPSALDAWQRQSAPSSTPARPGDRNDGRWVWALVLVLFGVEYWIRRRPGEGRAEVVHADAA